MPSPVDAIYEEIKHDIINLDITPGTKVKEEDLASKYHISRTPVRSVIARLVKDNLLVVYPQKGTYVSKIDINNINDYIFIRKQVEMSVIKKVCQIIKEDELKELEAILKEQYEIILMEPSIKKSKMFFHNDNKFHATLFKICNLEGVWRIIHSNAVQLNRVRIMSNLRDVSDVEKVYEQHYTVYENLKNHNEDAAIKAFSDHLENGFDGLNKVIEKYKDYFTEN